MRQTGILAHSRSHDVYDHDMACADTPSRQIQGSCSRQAPCTREKGLVPVLAWDSYGRGRL
jgi:hypothetical protein